ncbi:hypothetical protein [Paraferrimonas sedimenticola]|uniref:Lipoprotein n=1 Tax=Paraferrimonas sedimenticola TaxID=375674 RepID=A0AA37VZ20_9GAMM|nr:hypothetical protein [Paraferrimonas sedimenticola]GLP96969.1 hypothetical protein GCM10007895_22750 [Paraferrimonas sedimenticola]
MELRNLFKLGALASALALAGCGGDININTGGETVEVPAPTPTPDPDTKTPQEEAYEGFAQKSTTFGMIDGKEVWELTGTLAPATGAATGGQDGADITLGDDVVWLLDGPVVVGGDNESSVNLTIEPGTKILGGSDSYLVISRGSTIMADGTAEAPIVFTSVEAGLGQPGKAGQWGGLVILGNAPVNTCPNLDDCAASFEVGNYSYGGNNSEDNSGSLTYVRVEFGGFKINDTQEMNGISFGGVGSGTQVSYIQVHENNDDGVEFWGGNVSISNVVLTNNFDDSLDWTNGWQGSAQHVYIRQKDNGSNRGIEADSNSSAEAVPQSNPTLANFTIEVANGTNAGGDDVEGILLRKGTAVNAYNMLVKGDVDSGECLEIDGDNTVVTAQDGNLNMSHSIIDCVEPFKNQKVDADDGYELAYDVEAWFMGQQGNLAVASDLDGYMPNASSPALSGGQADLGNMDARLEDAQYIGAFDGSNDWTQGWTTDIHGDTPAPAPELEALNACPVGTTADAVTEGLYKNANVSLVCTLSGTYTSDVTLLAGSNVLYKVDGGAVIFGGDNTDSAKLNIQAGVNLFATDNSYIAVSRGSQIYAKGSAERPIVMTSQNDVIAGAEGSRGQWGGLVLLGNGLVNTCPDASSCSASFEVGDFPYGGDNNQDSSGQLSYVVVKYAGFKVNDTQEMNGISFAGVGSGTMVDHIQVHANGDDGVEFWGGAVNLKYVYLTHNFDDSLDWTNGWTGKVQYLHVQHQDNAANRGIEADSNSSAEAMPQSNPTLSNVTIEVGAGTNSGGDDAEGILLRKGTAAMLANVLVKGKDGSGECLEIDGDNTVATAQAGNLVMTHSVIDCAEPFKNQSISAEDGYTVAYDVEAWFTGQTGNGTAAVSLTDGIPATDDAALMGTGTDMSSDSFFDATDYIGAFDGSNDWRQGWTYTPGS